MPEPFRGDAALSAQLTDSEQSRRACLRGLLQKAVLGQDPDGPGDGSASHGNMDTLGPENHGKHGDGILPLANASNFVQPIQFSSWTF